MKKTISPFANESESLGIGDLTIENRTDRISIYGNIDLTRDKAGLEHARMLKAVLERWSRSWRARRTCRTRSRHPTCRTRWQTRFNKAGCRSRDERS